MKTLFFCCCLLICKALSHVCCLLSVHIADIKVLVSTLNNYLFRIHFSEDGKKGEGHTVGELS